MSSATTDSSSITSFMPHCIHVVGLGRTGAVYVEALLRTGEIEDHLRDDRARFAALVGEHAWIVDSGVTLPAGSAALVPALGSAASGATRWKMLAADALTGKTLPAPARKSNTTGPTKVAS